MMLSYLRAQCHEYIAAVATQNGDALLFAPFEISP